MESLRIRNNPIFSSVNFQKYMPFFIIFIGILIPIFFGIWRYETTSEPNRLRDAISCAVLSTPFSLGLWLSVTKLGRKIRYITLILVVMGALVHFIFPVYPLVFIPIVMAVEVYASYLLFRKVTS